MGCQKEVETAHQGKEENPMPIPTENVGSLPRPAKLQAAIKDYDAGKITQQQLTLEQDAACLDSIKRMEATGAPIVSDGEQRASSFATYPLTDTLAGTGLAENLAADGPSSLTVITGSCLASRADLSGTRHLPPTTSRRQ